MNLQEGANFAEAAKICSSFDHSLNLQIAGNNVIP
jgi:hypothetical protein